MPKPEILDAFMRKKTGKWEFKKKKKKHLVKHWMMSRLTWNYLDKVSYHLAERGLSELKLTCKKREGVTFFTYPCENSSH